MSRSLSDSEQQTSRRGFLKAAFVGPLSLQIFGCSENDSKSVDDRKLQVIKKIEFDHSCTVQRSVDFLHLDYFFLNMKPNNSGRTLQRIDKKKPANILIQLPPLHISEEIFPIDQPPGPNYVAFSLISGHSYISFEYDKDRLKNSPEKLLDWSSFRLITLEDLAQYECSPVNLETINENSGTSKAYPISAETGFPNKLLDKNGFPITLLELPSRMYLAPTYPRTLIDENCNFYHLDGVAQKYSFNNIEQPIRYWSKERKSLFELCNLRMQIATIGAENLERSIPSEFKVVAYDETDRVIGKHKLLPDPVDKHREKIARLTNLHGKNRNVVASTMNLSAMGATSSLKYENKEDNGTSLVAWNQEVSLGRDNYVQITFKGINALNLRVLITILAERVIENGVSYLRRREFHEFDETSKTFEYKDHARFPFRRIEVIEPRPVFITRKRLESAPVDSEDYYFYPLIEGRTELSDVIRFRYRAYDENNKIREIEVPEFVMMKSIFSDGDSFDDGKSLVEARKRYLEELFKSFEQGDDNLGARLKSNKVAYAPKFSTQVGDVSEVNHDFSVTNELRTEHLGFYYDFGDENQYEIHSAIKPRLHFAQINLPQLNGIAPLQAWKLVTYSDFYVDSRQKGLLDDTGSGVFANIVSEEIYDPRATLENYDTLDAIKVKSTISPISNVFSENYRNAGALVNPGIRIDAVSTRKQSITLTEKTKNVEYLRPSDILRDIKAEILGGIELRKILKEVLNIDTTPVFEMIDAAEEGFKQVSEYKEEYERLRARIEELPHEITRLKEQLELLAVSEITSYLNRKIDLQMIIQRMDVRATQLASFEKNIREIYAAKKMALINELDQAAQLAKYASDPAVKKLHALFNQYQSQNDIYASLYREIIELYERRLESLRPGLEKERYKIFFWNRQRKLMRQQLSGQYDSFMQNLEMLSHGFEGRAKDYFDQHYEELVEAYRESESFALAEASRVQNEVERIRTEATGVFSELEGKYESTLILIKEYRTALLSSQAYQTAYLDIRGLRDEADSLKNQLELAINPENILRLSLDPNFECGNGKNLPEIVCLQENLLEARKNFINNLRVVTQSEEIKEILTELEKEIPEIVDEKYDEYRLLYQALERKVGDVIDQEVIKLQKELKLHDEARREILQKIDTAETDLRKYKRYMENFVAEKVKDIETKIREENEELFKAVQAGLDSANAIRERIRKLEDTLRKIQSISKKEISYRWDTHEFREQDLGIVKFLPKSQPTTALSLNINVIQHFELGDFSSPPKLDRTETKTDTRLANFDINFFESIIISFDEVRFLAGDNVKDLKSVKINDVTFAGSLNFVQAFQNYLKTLDKGLKFDVDASGVTLGYGIGLPNITGGGFNFVNAKLSLSFFLPFQSNRSMALQFGLNEPHDMFLITVGIYGGRGCFQVTVEPKRGVVSILMVIEFGGVLYLNLGVAEGIVYLFAGIYLRKTPAFIESRGYVVCGGALNIIGLITVSASLYLGVEGRGSSVQGRATYTYSIEVRPFFEIDVAVTIYKRIKGATNENQNEETLANLYSSKGVILTLNNPLENRNGHYVIGETLDFQFVGSPRENLVLFIDDEESLEFINVESGRDGNYFLTHELTKAGNFRASIKSGEEELYTKLISVHPDEDHKIDAMSADSKYAQSLWDEHILSYY